MVLRGNVLLLLDCRKNIKEHKGESNMSKKSIHGMTKGTSLEKMTSMLAQAEAKGVMMYYALARLAEEQGLADAAEKFIEAAHQEADHAGFYAVLSGMYPKDFWTLVHGLQKAESSAETSLKKLADRFREQGLAEAAEQVDVFAEQEAHHGVLLQELLDRYQQNIDTSGKKIYVCGMCGYEYVGDIDSEPDGFVCPVCGQPKKVFRPAD